MCRQLSEPGCKVADHLRFLVRCLKRRLGFFLRIIYERYFLSRGEGHRSAKFGTSRPEAKTKRIPLKQCARMKRTPNEIGRCHGERQRALLHKIGTSMSHNDKKNVTARDRDMLPRIIADQISLPPGEDKQSLFFRPQKCTRATCSRRLSQFRIREEQSTSRRADIFRRCLCVYLKDL